MENMKHRVEWVSFKTGNLEPSTPELTALNTVLEWPVVFSMLQAASKVYSSTRESTSITKFFFENAESLVGCTMDNIVKPVSLTFKRPIQCIDKAIWSGLLIFEKIFPCVTYPTEKVVQTTKDYVFKVPCVGTAVDCYNGIIQCAFSICYSSRPQPRDVTIPIDSIPTAPTNPNPGDEKENDDSEEEHAPADKDSDENIQDNNEKKIDDNAEQTETKQTEKTADDNIQKQ